jgi:hypothetical protein
VCSYVTPILPGDHVSRIRYVSDTDTPRILHGYVSTTYRCTGPYWALKLSFGYVSAAVSAHQPSYMLTCTPLFLPLLSLQSWCPIYLSHLWARCAYESVVSSFPHSRSWIDLLCSKLAVFLTSPSCFVPRFTTWWPQFWDATGSPLYGGGSDHMLYKRHQVPPPSRSAAGWPWAGVATGYRRLSR